MSKSNQTPETKPDKKRPDQPLAYSQLQNQASASEYNPLLTNVSANPDPLDNQTTLLNNSAIPLAQRQGLATEIAHRQGNTHLQRVLEQGTFQGTAGSLAGVVQRSPLSDQLNHVWRMTHDKGAIFDELRSISPGFGRGDGDTIGWLIRTFGPGTDDFWLAETILNQGPEPLWRREDFLKRQQLASQHGWAPEPGHIEASLGTTAGNRPIRAFFFPGLSEERALIISGVHGSELSGIQVAEKLVADLRAAPVQPYYTVIIVPNLFPDNAATAAASPQQIGSTANVGRHTHGSTVDPNRQFPALGQAFDPGNPVDAKGRAIEPENIVLLELIQRFQPSRIASIHAVRDLNVAGIFADPRTDASGRALGYDSDRDLALGMARRARTGGAHVPANALGRRRPNAVYPRDPQPVAAGKSQPRDTKRGTSLGGWGSTEVSDPAHPEHNRPAMTVITIEVQTSHRIQDASNPAARGLEIQAHSDALREIFLGPPQRTRP